MPLRTGFVFFSTLALGGLSAQGCASRDYNSKSAPKIHGGVLAQPDDYPGVVRLWQKGSNADQPPYQQMCTGSFIHPRVVITAAHCVGLDSTSTNDTVDGASHLLVLREKSMELTAQGLRVFASEEKARIVAHSEKQAKEADAIAGFGPGRRKWQESFARKVKGDKALDIKESLYVASAAVEMYGWKPERAKMMPGFGLGPNENVADLALLLLPAGLPSTPTALSARGITDGEKLVFVGYGLSNKIDLENTSLGKLLLPQPLRYGVSTAIVDPTKSEPLASGTDWSLYFASIYDPSLKAKEPKHGLGCRGDSGGPVYRSSDKGDELVGITSRTGFIADADSLPAECDDVRFAMIYNRLDNSKTKAWIESVFKEWDL